MRPFEQLPFEDVPEAPRVPHRYFEIPSREVIVDGVRIHVREIGEGPPLLLVHGLMTTGYSFRYVAHRFAEKFRVVIVDLPGCGRSEKTERPIYQPRSLARFIGALIDTLEIRGCAVLGNSLGGYVCTWLAIERPDVMSRLLNLHSPARPEARFYALRGALSVPGTHSLLAWMMKRDPERWAHKNSHYYDETLKSREEAREYGLPLATPEGARSFTRYLAETASPRGFAELGTLLSARRDRGEPFPVPLLLVYARHDPMVSPMNGPYLKELIPDAELAWIEEGSHFAHVDAPDRFMEIALPFYEYAARR